MEHEQQHEQRWLILGIMSLSLIIVMLNNVTLNVALPELTKALGTTNTEMQWIMDAYALVFGGTLLTMGALGDRFGRRKALQTGLVMVAGASLWAALYASSSQELIAVRAIMGLGAALVMPATLSTVIVVFSSEERGKAIGIWAAMAGIGAPLGLLVGGWAVQNYDWQMVFFINIPVISIALVLGLIYVPESKDEKEEKLDFLGAILSIAALGSLLYAIIEAPSHGWNSFETLGTFALSALLLVSFVVVERKSSHPMLPMEFFKNPGFSTGLVAIMLAFFVMFSFMFTQMFHFQLIRGESPLGAAIRFFPLPFGLMPAAANSDKLVRKFGRNRVVGTGLLLVTLGMLLFTTVEIETPYWRLALTFFLLGLGMGLTMAPSTELVMEAIPQDKAGVGSATNDASREIGGALGIAIGGSVLNEFYQREFVLPPGLEGTPGASGFDTSFAAAIQTGQATGNDALLSAAREAFMVGMINSARVAAIIAALASIYIFTQMPKVNIPTNDTTKTSEEE
ncbi:MAG: MFS transporter [Candidatus Poseidonia sp.]|uniref:MFS transporter n=1 Tax=Poseidonia sp. TaxID=2666344 RepID=UPI0030C2BF69|nr:MFS transporter [Poseidonia sp.]